jgi:hypothetical protein
LSRLKATNFDLPIDGKCGISLGGFSILTIGDFSHGDYGLMKFFIIETASQSGCGKFYLN